VTAAEVVDLVEHQGLVGLQDHRGCSRREAELLDVRARRMIGLGLGDSPIGRPVRAAPATPPPPEPSADVQKVLAALDRMDRPLSGDALASRMDADRRQELYKRNVAEGYSEWAGLLDGGDR
jgi:hypothetical protein